MSTGYLRFWNEQLYFMSFRELRAILGVIKLYIVCRRNRFKQCRSHIIVYLCGLLWQSVLHLWRLLLCLHIHDVSIGNICFRIQQLYCMLCGYVC